MKRFNSIKKKLVANFVMPTEFKNILINRNLTILIKLSFGLIFFSVISLGIMIFSYFVLHKDNKEMIIYYSEMSILNITTFILSIIFKNKKNIKTSLRNFPLIVNFMGLILICYSTFLSISTTFNAMLFFICIATIIPLIFAFEPLFFSIIMIIVACLMAPTLKDVYGISSTRYSFVYIIITSVLSLNRWYNIKKSMEHEKETKAHSRQIQQELEMAAVVQKSFYHHNLSNLKDWEIVYYNDPMLILSGDLFDFFTKNNQLEGLGIFDVSGHGLSSGLVTMMVKNTLEEEFFANEDVELDYTMQRINKRVREEKGSIENYLTGIIVRLINENPEMVIAGHPSPLIYDSATKKYEYFSCDVKYRQGAIGLADIDYDFHSLDVKLKPNDTIIFYTDGITEAKNKDGREYGKERFLQSAQSHSNDSIADQIDKIVFDVKEFIGDSPRTDDISLIILKKK